MSLSSRPVQPVPPESMELVFFYRCPGCGRRNPLIAPTQPSMTARVLRGAFPRPCRWTNAPCITSRSCSPTAAPLWTLISRSFWGITGGGERKPF